jgi:hypothetical protein
LAVQDGRVVVAEVRVHPWEKIPPGGLTRRLLRRVPFGVHVDYFATVAKLRRILVPEGVSVFEGPWVELAAAHLKPTLEASPRPRGGKRPGRRPLPDEDLLTAARAYVTARDRGSPRPVPDAARALKMSEARMRDLVYRARRRGFLTQTSQGRGGGALTPHARALLKSRRRRQRRP